LVRTRTRGASGRGNRLLAIYILLTFGGGQPPGLGGGLQSVLRTEESPEPVFTTARFAPLAWSPVRRELAFGGLAGGADGVLPPGWLLPTTDAQTETESPRHAIWVVAPGETHADLVASSNGVYSAPCWAPDGESLYFVHWELATGGDGTLSLVRQYRTGKSDVVVHETGRFPFTDRRMLPFETASASSDGLLVAVPWLGPKGLAIVDLESRRIVRRFQQASAPVWSADSQSLAYYVSEAPSPSTPFDFRNNPKGPKQRNGSQLMVAKRTALLANKAPTPIGKSMGEFDGSQPVRWDQTGHTLIALRSLAESTATFDSARVQLLRISAAEGRAAKVFSAPSSEVKGQALFASFAFDHRTDSVFLCALRPDTRMMIDRFELSGSQSDGPWHPFEEADSSLPAPLGSVALSNDGKRLAFHFGRPELGAPVAVWNVEGDRTTMIHTDDAGDLRTAAVFAAAARRTYLRVQPDNAVAYQMTQPGAWDTGREHPNRLIIFPRRDHLFAMDDVRLLAVRRLAAEGLSFLAGRRQPQWSTPTKASTAFDEIALQLHYFREEFLPALRCVDRLTSDEPTPPDRRVMLAILRAQCLEATGSPSLARLSLEPILESKALQTLRSPDPESGPHPFIKRIEELRRGTLPDKPTNDETP
jgi:hypothetical protein